MSENYRHYTLKMAQRLATRELKPNPLRDQLADLLETVKWCETVWTVEERIEKSR